MNIDRIQGFININKDKQQPCWLFEEFLSIFDLSYYYVDNAFDKFSKLITEIDINTWTCTDRTVGLVGYLYKDTLLAISYQPYRKSDRSMYWVSNQAYEKMYKILLSLQKPPEIDLINDIDIHEFEYLLTHQN